MRGYGDSSKPHSITDYDIKKLTSEFEFDYVYDLQTSNRTSHYLKIFSDKKTSTTSPKNFFVIVVLSQVLL